MTTRATVVVVSVSVVIGLLARVIHLGVFPGLNPDEVEVALQWFSGEPLIWYVAPSGRPHLNPVGPLLLWPLVAIFEPSAWVVRGPALLAGVLLLPATFLMVRRAFDASAAGLVTVLVATSPFLIAYSRVGWDPAFVPLVMTLLLGAAYQRRPAWTLAWFTLLALIHPSAVFAIPLASAPFVMDWRRVRGHAPASRWLWLALGVGVVATVFSGLTDVPGLIRFINGFFNALAGPAIYAGFLGGDLPTRPASIVIAGIVVIAAGMSRLKSRGRYEELAILAALGTGLLAQYLAQGADVVGNLRERYLLWAAVPALMSLTFLIRAAFESVTRHNVSLGIVVALGLLGTGSFYTSYLTPFIRNGGRSEVLDYRSSLTPPKTQVLDIIRTHRRYPDAPVQIFIGESRLHLTLRYLSSNDAQMTVSNLGAVLYNHFQSNDREALLQSLDRFASQPHDVFFVDYDWDHLPGKIRDIHRSHVRPASEMVAPWTAHQLETAQTPDGAALITVWRLLPG